MPRKPVPESKKKNPYNLTDQQVLAAQLYVGAGFKLFDAVVESYGYEYQTNPTPHNKSDVSKQVTRLQSNGKWQRLVKDLMAERENHLAFDAAWWDEQAKELFYKSKQETTKVRLLELMAKRMKLLVDKVETTHEDNPAKVMDEIWAEKQKKDPSLLSFTKKDANEA